MRFYLPVLTILMATPAVANDAWFQLITPTGEVAKHSNVIVAKPQAAADYYRTDSDGRVLLPVDQNTQKGVTLEFAGRTFSFDLSGFDLSNSRSVKRIIVDKN